MIKNMFSKRQSIAYRFSRDGGTSGGGRLVVQTDINHPERLRRESKAKAPGVDVILAISSPGQHTQGLKDLGFKALFKHKNPNTPNVCTVWGKWGTGKGVKDRRRDHTYIVSPNQGEARLYQQGFPWYCGGGLRTVLQGPMQSLRGRDYTGLRIVQTNLSPKMAEVMKKAGYTLIKKFPDWKLWRSNANVRTVR